MKKKAKKKKKTPAIEAPIPHAEVKVIEPGRDRMKAICSLSAAVQQLAIALNSPTSVLISNCLFEGAGVSIGEN